MRWKSRRYSPSWIVYGLLSLPGAVCLLQLLRSRDHPREHLFNYSHTEDLKSGSVDQAIADGILLDRVQPGEEWNDDDSTKPYLSHGEANVVKDLPRPSQGPTDAPSEADDFAVRLLGMADGAISPEEARELGLVPDVGPAGRRELARLVPNPHPFRFLLKPPLCEERTAAIRLAMVVHSSPAHFLRRMVIRRTFGSITALRRFNATLTFALGAVEDTEVASKIVKEASIFGDLIQEDFIDAYRNLTYKGISWLRYFSSSSCPAVDFVLKLDDDSFVNPWALEKALADLKPGPGTIVGENCQVYPSNSMQVIRLEDSKWYVPHEAYPWSRFSRYCVGAAFLISGDLIRPLYRRSFETKYVSVDDFYLTGALPVHLAGVEYVQIGPLIHLAYRISPKKVASGHYVFFNSFSNHVRVRERRQWWRLLLDRYANSTADFVES